MIFLGYLRLFLLLCLVLLFSPCLFHTFLFFLVPVFIYLILMRFVDLFPKTFLFSLLFLFSLILFHLHRVFSILFLYLLSTYLSYIFPELLPSLVLFYFFNNFFFVYPYFFLYQFYHFYFCSLYFS